MPNKSDLETLAAGKPFIRSILAFLLYLRFGGPTTSAKPCNYNIGEAYCEADHFLDNLEKDVQK